ncbi:hypothetical protein MWH25_10400 [Natroniella acetigena]|uniref:hypothetical protein n=1 Tax=Natroniella acetigena TaxID=52004 RepID=UPI00200A3B6A|nr:hypothetical protein [Natroniella acetigena]MCK8828141.1 hypothetical protein [Natroniella acetigena]
MEHIEVREGDTTFIGKGTHESGGTITAESDGTVHVEWEVGPAPDSKLFVEKMKESIQEFIDLELD